MEEKNNNDQKVDMNNIKGEITLPTLDVKKYIGNRVKIDTIDVYKSEQYDSNYVELVTTPVDMIGEGNDKRPLLIRKRLWLQTNRDTQEIGWTKDSALGKLLLKYNKQHFKDLQGVEVIVQTEVRDGREWLTF